MRIILFSVLLAGLLAGCLSAPPPAPVNWTLTAAVESPARVDAAAEDIRLLQVSVRAPYDECRLAVLRGDGSIAFDAYNVFAAPPSALLKGCALDVLAASGRWRHVVPAASSALVPLAAEVMVETFALDCRREGAYEATVSLSLMILRGREIVSVVRGTASAPAGGDYSSCFSAAFVKALEHAIASVQE